MKNKKKKREEYLLLFYSAWPKVYSMLSLLLPSALPVDRYYSHFRWENQGLERLNNFEKLASKPGFQLQGPCSFFHNNVIFMCQNVIWVGASNREREMILGHEESVRKEVKLCNDPCVQPFNKHTGLQRSLSHKPCISWR